MRKKQIQNNSTKLKIADLFTLGNGICAMFSIIFIIKNQIQIATILILIGVLLDFLDGKIARFLKQENEIGKQLDSLCDVITFGVSICILSFTQNSQFYMYIILAFFLSCGIYRLAKFNIQNFKGYSGIPITTNGILFPILVLIKANYLVYPFALTIMGFLMIAPIKIKKII